MSERNAGTYLIIWQVLGKKEEKNILLPNLKGIRTWSYIKRDKSVRGDCVSS